MRGFATSRNPYFTGTRPRSFFGIRRAMIQKDILTGNGGKKFNPNWINALKAVA